MITGASSGIGLAAATKLACRGDRVVLVGRDPARLRAAADEVREASGERPEVFRADFAALDDVRQLAERLRAAYDRIDVLANNAGAIVLQPVTTVDVSSCPSRPTTWRPSCSATCWPTGYAAWW